MPKHDHHLPGRDHGRPSERNNPDKSEVLTTGTYKTEKTREEQITRHEDPNKVAQHAKPPHEGPRGDLTHKADSRLLEHLGERRDGSDSNAQGGRKQSRLHEDHRDWNTPQPPRVAESAEFDHELRPHDAALVGNDPLGLNLPLVAVAEIKELRELRVLPAGSRLEQGAHYLDLANLAGGELVAMGGMETQPGSFYVAKRDTEYRLWDMLKLLPHAPQPGSKPSHAAIAAPGDLALTTHVDE